MYTDLPPETERRPGAFGELLEDLDRTGFDRDGYLLVDSVIDEDGTERLSKSLDAAFAGRFDTGTYPDSWLWQEGTGMDNLPRQMVNIWKCDCNAARLVLCEEIARAAAGLMGWSGARLAADSVWMKPPRWREGGFHCDEMEIFRPADMITCWVALNDMSAENGSLIYLRGSHTWPKLDLNEPNLNPGDLARSSVLTLADERGLEIDLHNVFAGAGSISFHHGRTWHGSSPNETDRWRNTIGIHFVRPDTRFATATGGHVLGRYKTTGSWHLDENFFPLLWTSEGCRSAYLDAYLQDGTRG